MWEYVSSQCGRARASQSRRPRPSECGRSQQPDGQACWRRFDSSAPEMDGGRPLWIGDEERWTVVSAAVVATAASTVM